MTRLIPEPVWAAVPLFFGLVALVLPVLSTACQAGQHEVEKELLIRVKVRYVLDGDSIVVKKGSQELQVRLWGIDAPEHDQPYGPEAKSYLRRLLGGNELQLAPMDQDKYGRLVAIVYQNQLLINEALIRAGQAWVHRYYCRERRCDQWLHLENQARKQRRGLWKNRTAVAPWIWKRR